MEFRNKTIQVLLDPGATRSFISPKLIEIVELVHDEAITLVLGDGQIVKKDVHNIAISLKYNEQLINVSASTLNTAHDLILGMNFFEEYNPIIDWRERTMVFNKPTLLQNILNNLMTHEEVSNHINLGGTIYFTKVQVFSGNTNPDRCNTLLDKYHDVFDEPPPGLPPERGVAHKITLQPDAALPKGRAPYRLSIPQREELKKTLQELSNSGYIRVSSAPFSAPVIFVPKKDGSLRMCIDYRALNDITIKDHYPIPLIEDLFDKLSTAKLFSKIDLRSGYHQIRMHDDSIEKTAFITRFGLFEFTVLPFGLCNAPATFQRMMNRLFVELIDSCVIIYLDDILIYSANEEDHLEHIESVLKILKANNLYARKDKCEFFVAAIGFLGHVFENGTIQVDTTKTDAISTWPVPQSKKDVRSFLGLARYYQRFVKDFAKIAAPLDDCTKKDTEWLWSSESQKAFDTLKQLLVSAPVLKIFTPGLQTNIRTDACPTGIGAVLTQSFPNGDGTTTPHPICFLSRKLNKCESTQYAIYEQELLAIVFATKKLRMYLDGIHFTVFTDHKPLLKLMSKDAKEPSERRVLRLCNALAKFDFNLVHVKGKNNAVADALSRNAVLYHCLSTKDNSIKPSSTLIDTIRIEQQKDPRITLLRNNPTYTLVDDIIHKGDLMCIPNSLKLKQDIIRDAHDILGHFGRDKTLGVLQKQFLVTWRGIRNDVHAYCRACKACQAAKSLTTAPQGKLMPLPIPTRNWERVSMDFMGAFPVSVRGNNEVIVWVDHLSKMVHIAPCKDTTNAEDTAYLFFDNVFKLHGLPSTFLSDRDSRWTGRFWNSLIKLIGVNHLYSTAFHPQTDGLTEVFNKIIQGSLRSMILNIVDGVTQRFPSNWDDYIPILEFSLNNHQAHTIGTTPFKLNGQDPVWHELSVHTVKDVDITASQFAVNQKHALDIAKKHLQLAQTKMKHYADKHRKDITFQLGEMVLVKTDNITLSIESSYRKFKPRYIGPFKIIQVINPNAYRLEMPSTHNSIHDVFNITNLRKYHTSDLNPSLPGPLPDIIDDNEEYEIEKILDERTHYKKLQYLCQWKGYPPEQAQWVMATDMDNAKQLVTDWLAHKADIRKQATGYRSTIIPTRIAATPSFLLHKPNIVKAPNIKPITTDIVHHSISPVQQIEPSPQQVIDHRQKQTQTQVRLKRSSRPRRPTQKLNL